MTDIADRLRAWTHFADVVPASDLMDEAAAEIGRLREAIRRLAERDATLSLVCKRKGSQVVTLTMDATLTDAEREAIERAIETLDGWQKTGGYHSAIEDDAATLRGVLDRLTPVRSGDCDRPKPIKHTQETQATPCKCRVRTKGTCE